jgi:N-acetylmuramoyl-L-alanine amidase/putative methionine-R-sulfoxide reductase with GAF domain
MSANPTNASLELAKQPEASALPDASRRVAPGFEALQALLAFSSLHDQIRQRRARELRTGARLSPEDAWELEQFVLDEVLQLVAERALALTGADGVAIALADGDEIICRASSGEIAPDAGARLDPNSGFSGACLRTGQIIRCDDTEYDSRVNVQASRTLGARSMVAVPLVGQQGAIGLIEAFSYDAHAFNDSDVRSLNLLSELILSALRPEEEDRLAQVSQQVVARAVGPAPDIESEREESPTAEPEVTAPCELAPSDNGVPFSGPAPFAEYAAAQTPRPGLSVVFIVVLLGIAAGAGAWWTIQHKVLPAKPAVAKAATRAAVAPPQVGKPVVESTPEASNPDVSRPDVDSSTAEPPLPVAEPADSTSAVKEKLAVLPLVTGLRHWSSADSSSVAVDLQDQVQYEAHRLTGPERIYIDLHDTRLSPELSGRTVDVGDALLSRVRIAQPMPGVTRVVLDTKGGSNFSVSLEPNPYRLVVEVRGISAKPKPQAKVELFGPATPPQTASLPATTSGNDQKLRVTAPKFRIVLDAGHGGWDLGTVGRQGLLEKDLVLDIVDRVGELVSKRLGSEVIYTRQDDNYVALEKRAEIANQAQADLFLSVHANYSVLPSARGVETYYTNTFSSAHAHTGDPESPLQNVSFAHVNIREKVQESHRFAASVQRALYGTLAAKNSGIRDRGVKEASYVVLTGTSMPAILAEVSFVSSPTDEQNLQSTTYRQQIAEALYKGVARYVSSYHKVKIASVAVKPSLH